MFLCWFVCNPLGSEEDLFYDAPSSPVGDKPFFPDNPMPLRYADLHKRKSLIKEDTQKNMTEFIMTFEISEVQRSFCGTRWQLFLTFHIAWYCNMQCLFCLLLQSQIVFNLVYLEQFLIEQLEHLLMHFCRQKQCRCEMFWIWCWSELPNYT